MTRSAGVSSHQDGAGEDAPGLLQELAQEVELGAGGRWSGLEATTVPTQHTGRG